MMFAYRTFFFLGGGLIVLFLRETMGNRNFNRGFQFVFLGKYHVSSVFFFHVVASRFPVSLNSTDLWCTLRPPRLLGFKGICH